MIKIFIQADFLPDDSLSEKRYRAHTELKSGPLKLSRIEEAMSIALGTVRSEVGQEKGKVSYQVFVLAKTAPEGAYLHGSVFNEDQSNRLLWDAERLANAAHELDRS